MVTSSTNISSVQSMLSKAKAKLKELKDNGHAHWGSTIKDQEQKIAELEAHLDKLKHPYLHKAQQPVSTAQKPIDTKSFLSKYTGLTAAEIIEQSAKELQEQQKKPATQVPDMVVTKNDNGGFNVATVTPTTSLHNVHVNLTIAGMSPEIVHALTKALLTSLQSSHHESCKGFSIDGISWTDKSGDWFIEVGVDGKLQHKEKQIDLSDTEVAATTEVQTPKAPF